MVNPTQWRKWSYLAVALAAVLASGALHEPLVEMRDTWSWRPAVENFPPSLVLGTQMLGSFRGMLVVGLWVRATALQEEGRYYELVQLFDWITELEPRLESVWAYSAWNQAYNISVAFPDCEDRWRWVQNGLSVLRDRGLVFNPRSYMLNHHLAWIYFHKVGGTSDECHVYYKQEFAKTLHVILDGPTPDYARLAAAPRTDRELLADETVRSLVEQARAAGFEPLERDIAWLNDPSALPEAVVPIFEAARETPAFDALDAFLRARALRENWRIEPARVKALVDEYGPLDFRQPEAHALYWGAESLRHVKPTDNRQHGERMVYFSLVKIFESGRLHYLPKEGVFSWLPDIRFADAVRKDFLRKFELLPEAKAIGPRSAYKNWMRNAIAVLYQYGAKEKAEEFRKALYEFEPRREHEGPIEEFVVREVRKDLEQGQYEQVAAYIRGYIRLHYYWLALGEQEVADAHLAMAKLFYILYQQEAPPRFFKQLGTWEALLTQSLERALDPERGFGKPLRNRLREALGIPPERDEERETDEAA